MIIFDGVSFANSREAKLRQQVAQLRGKGVNLKIAAILFTGDPGSLLYTAKKKESAGRVGIEYEPYQFSMLDPLEKVVEQIQLLNQDKSVTGIIVQKPTRSSYIGLRKKTEVRRQKPENNFNDWWRILADAIIPSKDVDGLTSETLEAIRDGSWQEKGKVLPATCRAVVEILGEVRSEKQEDRKVVILGKSDLLGKPLYYYLKNQGVDVELIGSEKLEERRQKGIDLQDADVIVTATGKPNLITGEMIKEGVIIIDAGEPVGDVDFESVKDKVSFITPVPGGVGPMTVECLLENCLELVI